MFSQHGKSLPPPPSSNQSRNESLGASLPTYRSRPSGSGNSGSSALNFSSVRSVFEAAKPMGSTIVNLTRNPLVRSAAVEVAKDEKLRAATVSAVQNPNIRNAALNFATSQSANATSTSVLSENFSSLSKVDEIARQFENRPVMGFASSNTSSSTINLLRPNTVNSFSTPPPIAPKPANSQWTASQRNLFDFPLQLPSSPTGEAAALYDETPGDVFTASYRKKTAPPSRPPPPKMTLSRSNPNLNRLVDELRGIDFFATTTSPPPGILNEPYAIVKYPYRETNTNELSCQPDDIVILKREVDDQWIYATNTRTGRSGIVPLLFLQIRVPLAPSSGIFSGAAAAASSEFTGWSKSRNQMSGYCVAARALYDYNTDVDGDLQFKAGDIIIVNARVNAEWLRGEAHKKSGIFPLSFVNLENPSDLNRLADESKSLSLSGAEGTLIAAFDYTSDIEGDLAFRAGDTIEVLQRHEGAQWVTGRLARTGDTGLVPLTYTHQS